MKFYDRRYFDRWYRDPRHQVVSPAGRVRRVRFALAAAEHLLDRPVRRVLDVGCGEGAWGATLHRLRPDVRYDGIDSSAYAIARFGRRRGLRFGTFGALDQVADLERYDLVVCVDVLHYLERGEIDRGLAVLGARLRGVAYLHALTSSDGVGGDVRGWKRRHASFYRGAFARAGLTSCGLSCYVGFPLGAQLAALDAPSPD